MPTIIYSNLEGSPSSFANYVEVHVTDDHIIVRGYHQRPIRRAPMDLGADQVVDASHDTIENALQAGLVLTPSAAVLLHKLLDAALKQKHREMFPEQ